MANLTSAINVQVDTETKNAAINVLNDLGLSMSAAINIFLKQVIKTDGLPFPVVNKKPTNELLEALKETYEIEKGIKKVDTYASRDELKKALLQDE